MNVLWIEDFGGNSSPKLATTLFSDLARDSAFDDHWHGKDPASEPQDVEEFFKTHSALHQVTLIRHYGDYCKKKETADILLGFDVVVIDINLSKGATDIPPPSDLEISPDEFHRRAGFYIYYDLLRSGFPADHMCFFTGEPETCSQFKKFCDDNMIPRPKDFGKYEATDGQDINAFRRWLKDHRQSSYMTLRRGVIEGCKLLREHLTKSPEDIQFNEFRPNDTYQSNDMDDYLLSLCRFLPAKCPRNDELPRMLRLLTRSLVHEWEGDYESESGAHPKHINAKGKHSLQAMGWVMKTARNWMAHSQVLNELIPQDVAYLFMINMRAMFPLQPDVQRYERTLLSIFQTATSLPDKSAIKKALEDSYQRLKTNCQKVDIAPFQKFQKLANAAEEAGVDLDYSTLLYQILWHQLADGQFESRKERYIVKRDPVDFQCNDINKFFWTLLAAIYDRSFRDFGVTQR